MVRLFNTALSAIALDVEGCFHLYTTRYREWPERIIRRDARQQHDAANVSSARYLTSKQTRCINAEHDAGVDLDVEPQACATRPGSTAAEQQATTVPVNTTVIPYNKGVNVNRRNGISTRKGCNAANAAY